MKLVNLKLTILLLIVAVNFSSCKKKNEELTIIGKWKLIEVSIWKNYQLLEEIDYSSENIIYDFQKNNKLIITGNIPNDLFVFDNFQAGEHFYEYNEFVTCPTCLPGPNLLIDNPKFESPKNYYCLLFENEPMKINSGGNNIIENEFFAWSKTFVKLN